jgi:hypothetical protein
VHTEGHSNQRAWTICKLVLFRVQLHSLDLVSSQQPLAKSPRLSPGNRLGQEQPQVATTSAFLQIGGNVLASQRSGQETQALPSLGVVSIKDEKPRPAFLVKQICAQSDLTPQVGKKVANVQLFVHADIAAVVKLVGVQVPPLDKPLSQHQGWPREFCVWKWQAFALDHRVTSIAHLGNARQAIGRFALGP